MKKYLTCTIVALVATVAVSIAATPDKAAMEAREKSAWQAFKDKNSDAFKKLVDKDIRCVYANRISTGLQNELADMKNWDMKSFEISDFEMFSDEKDVVVTTYKVKVEGTADGKDASGTYNSGRQFREFASRFVKRQVWRPTTSRFVDLLHVSLILSEKENAGEPQWLRVQHFARKVLETP